MQLIWGYFWFKSLQQSQIGSQSRTHKQKLNPETNKQKKHHYHNEIKQEKSMNNCSCLSSKALNRISPLQIGLILN